MHQADATGKIPNKVAFDCATSVYLNKVFSSGSDESGVVLFGTVRLTKKGRSTRARDTDIPFNMLQASQNNAAGYDHVYVLQDLDVPSASRIKEVEAFGSGEV